MRIALVTSEYVTESAFDGGLATYVHRLALSLKAMKHEPVVIVTHELKGQPFQFDDGIEVQRVQTWHLSRSWKNAYTYINLFDRLTFKVFHMSIYLLWSSFRAHRRIKRLHREQPFDLVHYAHLGGFCLLRDRRIPAVTRLSGHTKLCHQLGGYGEANFQMWQQLMIERMALKRSDAVFGPSKRVAALIGRQIKKPITVIESPFLQDVSRSDSSVFNEHLSGKTYLLFFGSIALLKGVGTIAEMIGSFLEEHPNLHFVFVGKRVPRQQGGDLMDRVWEGADTHRDRVLWIDAMPKKQLYPIIENAHIVVLPSRVDNFPNACIEAMAFHRIVIGTKGNGFEQLIEHGSSGFLTPIDDAARLQETIEMVLSLTKANREEIESNARKRIDMLQPENVVSQLLDLYLDTIESHHRSITSPRLPCVALRV